MKRSSAAWCAVAIVLVVAAAPAAGGEVHSYRSLAPFQKVQDKLSRAKAATVSAACGTAAAPWGYRGARGDSLTLKAFVSANADERWGRDLANLLMRRADWDSTDRFLGVNKLCREQFGTPYFVVGWHAGKDDIYTLFNFEARCALVFDAKQPLGTVWIRDRADTLFQTIRKALAADSIIRSMAMPLENNDSRTIFGPVWVEDLPEAIVKVPPEYPLRAREEGWHGTVDINALIGKDGMVHDAYVAKSVRGLDDAALACVWDWRFQPARTDGKPLVVWVRIPVKFTLTN